MNRESLQFGQGSFVGTVSAHPEFFLMPVQDQARILGWANSCPVVEELTDPNNTAPGRGPEAMIERYGQINFWFGYIAREVETLNPNVYEQLMTPMQRCEGEEVGKHEAASVPVTHFTEMAPLSTLAGFSLPRLFIEQLGLGKGLSTEMVRERFARGQAVLEVAATTATSPNELLALVSEGVAHADVDPRAILKNVLSAGWLDEHNALTMRDDFLNSLQRLAPTVWQTYTSVV
jgi:hypothetical protein